MTENLKNELVKRKYRTYLKEAKKQADSSILIAERAIQRYEEFWSHEDFGLFKPDRAIEFKKHIRDRLALASYGSTMRQLKNFFVWLACQPGYKSKINLSDLDYFQVSNAEDRIINSPPPRNFPPLESVIKLVASIPAVTEIDLRDRALIAFACLTGMRDAAIVSLPMGCFDAESLQVNQSPKYGVHTKFSKSIVSIVFRFDEGLLKCVLDWHRKLKEMGFGTMDPLFPRAKVEPGHDTISFESPTKVERGFWKGAGRMREIFKQRSQAAGLPYFPPHTYRHLAVSLAMGKARTGAEMKAVSQNFGHEHIGTSLAIYGNYQPEQLVEVLHKLDGRQENKMSASDLKVQLQKLAEQIE